MLCVPPVDPRAFMSRSIVDAAPFGQYAPRGLCALALRATRACSTGWLGKRTAFLLRGLALRLLGTRPLDVVSLGARLKGDFVFLDVGASVGGYALFAAGFGGPRARILAVEPLPEVFERLVYNIGQSACAKQKAVGCALLDVDGEITLFVNPGNQGETSVRIVGSQARGE